jgi:hypothetical protein
MVGSHRAHARGDDASYEKGILLVKINALKFATAGAAILSVFAFSQPLLAQTNMCIPQFVDGTSGGLRWQTSIILQNQAMTQAQVMLQLYNTDGRPLAGMMMNRLGPGGMQFQSGSNGQLNPNPINARSMLAYRSPGTEPFQNGFLMIQSQTRIQAHTMLHLHDFSGNLLSETGIIPHPPFAVGSFWINPSAGPRYGLSLANSSATNPATVTLEFFADDGITPLGTVTLQLGPRTQIAKFVDEWFTTMAPGATGFVRITATSSICGLALQLRGLVMTQIPILIEIE